MLPQLFAPRPCRIAAIGAALLGTACAAGARPDPGEGPFLAPGPLPGVARDLRSSPALPPGMSPPTTVLPDGATPSPRPVGLPAGLTASGGTARLPGAEVPGIGPVRVLVVPVSLGPELPARDDAALARDYFGAGTAASAATVAGQLVAMSDGRFRPGFEILPTLVDSRARAPGSAPRGEELLAFARAVLQSWAERTDLSRFDDDGPDGIPSSPDDDGRLDCVMLVVQSATPFPSVTLRQDLMVQTSRGSIRVGALHVLSFSRAEPSDLRPAIGLALDALGLDPGERFFAPPFPRTVSTLARVRLGWLPAQVVSSPGAIPLVRARALLYPLLDIAEGAGFWLMERDSDAVFVSRVARKPDGHFATTEAHVVRAGEGQVLPLTRQFGEQGARVALRWRPGAAPEAELVGADADRASGTRAP